jgi:hypothetical protein
MASTSNAAMQAKIATVTRKQKYKELIEKGSKVSEYRQKFAKWF